MPREPEPLLPRFAWNQPICNICWIKLNPDREPVRLKHPERETCVHCAGITDSGIWVRINPKNALHPTKLKED